MKTSAAVSLLALALALPRLALAQASQSQTPTPAPATSDLQQDKQQLKQDVKDVQADIKADQEKLKDLGTQHADAVKDLNAKEKAAFDVVKDDKSLTDAQKKAKLADIRKDWAGQRKAINDKDRAVRAGIQKDIRADRRDLRRDVHQARAERRDIRQDSHAGKR